MNVTQFRKFAEIFVPFYEDMCRISGKSPFVKVKINSVRELLCREFPDECAMLTAPFIEWLREPLAEMGIDILFDRKNSLRSGEMAFTRSYLLNEKEERITHYLVEKELQIINQQ